MQGASGRRHQGQIGDSIPHFALDFPRKESVCGYGHRGPIGSQRFLVTKVLSSSKPGVDPRLRPLDPGENWRWPAERALANNYQSVRQILLAVQDEY